MYNAVSRFEARMPFTISVSVFSNTMFAMKVTLALLSKYGSIGVRGCLGAFRVAGRNPQFAIRNSQFEVTAAADTGRVYSLPKMD